MLNSMLSFMVDKPLAILGIIAGAVILDKGGAPGRELLVRRLGRRRASHGPGLLRRHSPPSRLHTGRWSARVPSSIEALAVTLAGAITFVVSLGAIIASVRVRVRGSGSSRSSLAPG